MSQGRGFITQQMSQRSGLHYSLGRVSWSPWSGLNLYMVKVYKSDRISQITEMDRLIVKFDTRSLVQGKIQLEEMLVEAPVLEVSDELVRGMLDRMMNRSSMNQAEQLAINDKLDGNILLGRDSKSVEINPTPVRPQQKVEKAKKEVEEASLKRRAQPDEVKGSSLLRRLEVKGGSFRLKNSDGGDWIFFKDVTLAFPLGEETTICSVGEVSIGEEAVARDFKVLAEMTEFGLKLDVSNQKLAGVFINCQALVSDKGDFELKIEADTQHGWRYEESTPWADFHLGGVMARIRGGGNLRNLQTVRGSAKVALKGFKMIHPSKKEAFDTVLLNCNIMKGLLMVDQFDLDSPELKVRAQGLMNSRGEVRGLARVIATEDEAANVHRFFGGVQVHFPMQKFVDTEDVFFNDVEIKGNVFDPYFKSSKHWRSLREKIVSARFFLNKEADETRSEKE